MPLASALVRLDEHQLEELCHLGHGFRGQLPIVGEERLLGAVHDRLVGGKVENVSVVSDELFCGSAQSTFSVASRRDHVSMIALKRRVQRHRLNSHDEFYRRVVMAPNLEHAIELFHVFLDSEGPAIKERGRQIPEHAVKTLPSDFRYQISFIPNVRIKTSHLSNASRAASRCCW